jgi:nicotinate-nucleotide pyrophosphorylase (carboxylating)
MQRMSGIATLTKKYTQKLNGYHTKLLDTRKTTPNFRLLEKEAVRIGGGINHRFGLYDMIMLKDNHIDYCGGIIKAIQKAHEYSQKLPKPLKIEVETRSIKDVALVCEQAKGMVFRIMLDNFSPTAITEAMKIINGEFETEASGGIHLENIASYAATGVDYISVGGLIHQAKSLDLSLKAELV